MSKALFVFFLCLLSVQVNTLRLVHMDLDEATPSGQTEAASDG